MLICQEKTAMIKAIFIFLAILFIFFATHSANSPGIRRSALPPMRKLSATKTPPHPEFVGFPMPRQLE